MKNLNRILKIMSVTMVLSFASCQAVDIDPTHILDGSNAFKSMDDVESHLTGTYAYFRGYYANFGVLGDIMTDNLAETSESLGGLRSMSDWNYVANDGTVATAWATPYSMIKDANLVITNVGKFEETEAGQAARIKGQALAIRAFAHFELLKYFAIDYDRNSTELGVPLKLNNTIETPSRNTVEEVYDQVYADLADAKDLLSGTLDEDINSASSRTRIDAVVVDAIMARVALYAKDYATAIDAATNVIEDSGLGLADPADFASIWSEDAVANEVIWSIAYLPGQGQVAGNVFFVPNNRVAFNASQDLIALYDTDDDIRYGAYFSDELETPDRVGELVPIKYLGRNGAADGVVNFKVFRVSEMYLIRAEAYARTSQDALAMDDLNTLRAARINGYVDENLSGAILLQAIDTERRRELFLEGHRWFDLRRADAAINRGGDCAAPATACELAASSHRWVWPIPQAELNANPSIRGQQNPNY